MTIGVVNLQLHCTQKSNSYGKMMATLQEVKSMQEDKNDEDKNDGTKTS